MLGIAPPLMVTALLFYGLTLLGHFQKQERVWHYALDRAKILGLLNVGLSPFLFWWNQLPHNQFFGTMVGVLMSSGIFFLMALNPVLRRLSAMLPDEALRLETKFFTTINFYLLLLDLVLLGAYFVSSKLQYYYSASIRMYIFNQATFWLLLLLVLVPLAMTMALIWKVKEVILASVFGSGE